MLPPQTRSDPDGYYRCLGVAPEASRAEIVAAFRRKARRLHPDVPRTGDAAAFVALRQAYDVLSKREQRAAYDRKAHDAALAATEPIIVRRTADPLADPLGGQYRSAVDPGLWQGRSTGSATEQGRSTDAAAEQGRPTGSAAEQGRSTGYAAARGGSAGKSQAWWGGFSTLGAGWLGRSASDRPPRQAGVGQAGVGQAGVSQAGVGQAGVRPAEARQVGARLGGGLQSRASEIPLLVWVGLAAFLCLSVYQAAVHLMTPRPKPAQAEISANAAVVAPLSPSAHEAVLYGPAPVRLAGVPNFYVGPGAGPAMLWTLDRKRNVLLPLGRLPPFSMVQALRLFNQNGMVEVLLNARGNGLISASRLTPGDPAAAHRAYCGYNAGPAPRDGELLERRGSGGGRLELENRALQPAVVKLRDDSGAVVVSVFLEPQGRAVLDGMPNGTLHPEFAIGELWSRACNSFAAGMRAWRMQVALGSAAGSLLVVEPDAGAQAAANIPDQAFERN
ncbi:J domain-containing protein [Rhodopila sp.]|uniref:J domain-containing protein n=1 Tax=Rhodopila sp. TaxID=2480087 RepID=UPI003D09984B